MASRLAVRFQDILECFDERTNDHAHILNGVIFIKLCDANLRHAPAHTLYLRKTDPDEFARLPWDEWYV